MKPICESLLKSNLEKEGYAVRTAANAAEALDILKSSRPDLILCDVMLPDMIGTKLANQVKK